MAGGDDFYSRDRPAHPVLPEDRPRGGGGPGRGPRNLLLMWLLFAVLILVLFLIFI